MPRISAPTVAEHRTMIRGRLLDAAEEILRTGGDLTAGAVSASAGIARNSIYRYVDSVDDLRVQVVTRYLPDWLDAVSGATANAGSPADTVVAWVDANLRQAARSGHGWLMAVARLVPVDATVPEAHRRLRSTLAEAWRGLCPADPMTAALATSMTAAIVDAGFRELDSGRPTDAVLTISVAAARALTTALPLAAPRAESAVGVVT